MSLTKQLITVQPNQRVLVVEDSEYRIKWFAERLNSGPVQFATTPRMALDILSNQKFDVIFLDHDAGIDPNIGPVNFMCVANKLAEIDFQGEVIIHSMNYQAAARMRHVMRNGHITMFGDFELRRV
jgi:CheY-like chemotaxis protein